MKHGCYNTLLDLFELMNYKGGNLRNDFFNRGFFMLLESKNVEEIKLDEADLNLVIQNGTFNYAHLAALNPSGAGLKFLLQR